MRFSEYYGTKRSSRDTWFDPILDIDTPLFVDPFLVFRSRIPEFKGAHDFVVEFFNVVFKLIATTKGKCTHPNWSKAVSLLHFPEPKEICLGYSDTSIMGRGSGGGISSLLAHALWECVERGIVHISHFEEVSIFRKNLGADRISDAVVNLIRPFIANYTERICSHYGIPTVPVRYSRGQFNCNLYRWDVFDTRLPLNPMVGRGHIMLLPETVLKELPTISPWGFFDYVSSHENHLLRQEFGNHIKSHVKRAEILSIARKVACEHPEAVENYLSWLRSVRPTSYDLERDEKGIVRWHDATQIFCNQNALIFRTPANEQDFIKFIEMLIRQFKMFVEEEGGTELLWDDRGRRPKNEKAAQRLLFGIVKHYCKANNIDLSKETNIARGPVDLKLSNGYEKRALLELKLARNPKLKRGFEKQLPQYLRSEEVTYGFYGIVIYRDSERKKALEIRNLAQKAISSEGFQIKVFLVDATSTKLSASRL